MDSGTKYFILNQKTEWKKNGIIENLLFNEDSMISNNKNSNNGFYITTSFDSLQEENIWHRLRLEANIPQNAILKLRIYASDSLYTLVPGKTEYGDNKISMDEYLKDVNIAIKDKLRLFDYLEAKEFENPSDLVLFEFKGRYLWICMEFINYNTNVIEINKLKIETMGMSFVEYLPQIYRGRGETDSFLSRFLFIFQSLYTDLNDEIDKIPRIFAPEQVDGKFLNWLAQWFSIEDVYIWGEEKLRILLKNIIELYKIKGTKECIKKVIKIYLGEVPIIVEQFEVADNDLYIKSKENIENLFGDNGYVFTVILKTNKSIEPETYAELMKIISRFKPIDTICNLVVLNNEIYLDYHCYLEVNSYLESNKNIVLDNNEQNATQLLLVNSDKT